jgi:23S rRNA (uracil-5-)-methyltransferase RumA
MATVRDEICPHFGVCGGCATQNILYDNQLKKKEGIVRSFFADLHPSEFQPILPSPDIFYYRNKMEFSFGNKYDVWRLKKFEERSVEVRSPNMEIHLGLHPKGRFALVAPTPECRLQSEESQRVCETVATWASRHQIPVYIRKKNEGVLRHLVIREGKNTHERMVNLFTTGTLEAEKVSELADILKAAVPITTFLWTVNDALSDVAQGDVKSVYWGNGVISERVNEVELRITPSSFMQTNTKASERMTRILRQWIDNARPFHVDGGTGTLVDLYCGTGTIGLNLAPRFKRLIGIESNDDAVQDARANAVANGILNTEFITGRVEDLTAVLKGINGIEDAVIVVDPPRPGLHAKVSQALLDVSAPTVFYVSCNPETLARDLRLLGAKYRIERVQPMDFFPHTDHVETLVQLKKI